MPISRIEIDATNVAIGMYIAMLDRPWLQTPFLFQGFEVKDRSEIEMLHLYCRTVFIDTERSNLSAAEIRHLDAKPRVRKHPAQATKRARSESNRFVRYLKNLLRRLRIVRDKADALQTQADGYAISSTVRAEASKANTAYAQLSSAHIKMLDDVRTGGSINTNALRRAVRPAVESVLRNPDAMAWTVFSRKLKEENYSRAIGTAVWCILFGRHLGLDKEVLQELAVGGLTLDIGTARMAEELTRVEGEISAQHRQFLSQHVGLGSNILADSNNVSPTIVEMLQCHHERADGSGYPQQLVGNKIPAFGRIAAICDTYDAMTTENAYSPPMAGYDCARALNSMRGEQFAAEVVEQFLGAIGMFPTASVVELNGGSIAVVLEQNRQNALRPKLLVVLDEKHCRLNKPKVLQMRDQVLDKTDQNAVWIVAGHEPGAFGVDPMEFFG
jgi:HD-GYP domain-containing protein (c-di-GMP phosphodiesterase class II)